MFNKRSDADDPYREIAKRVWQLGNLIQKFAKDHYSLQMSDGWDKFAKKPRYLRYLLLTTPESPKYRSYLTDSKERPKVVGGFVWRVLVFELFECFHWLGGRNGRHLLELREQLRPAKTEGVDEDVYETQCDRFSAWSGATIELLGRVLDGYEEQELQLQREYEERKKRYIAANILATIGHGGNPYKEVLEDLLKIVQKAWALDVFLTGYKEIQLFEWRFGTQPSLEGPREVFNPDTDVDWDDDQSRPNPLVGPDSDTTAQASTSKVPENTKNPPSIEKTTAANTTKPKPAKPAPLSLQTMIQARSRHIRLVCSPALVKFATDDGRRVETGSETFFLKRAVSLTPGDDPADERLDTSLKLRFPHTSPTDYKKAPMSAQGFGTPSPARSFTVPANWGKVVEQSIPTHWGNVVSQQSPTDFSPITSPIIRALSYGSNRSPGPAPLDPTERSRPGSPVSPLTPGTYRRLISTGRALPANMKPPTSHPRP
ncbi:hypothetical protein V8F33_012128 [Rhypophila sp. PSN 637]